MSTIAVCFVFAGVISIFEDYYKATNPTMAEIEYDLASVVQFVDAIHDLSCLV